TTTAAADQEGIAGASAELPEEPAADAQETAAADEANAMAQAQEPTADEDTSAAAADTAGEAEAAAEPEQAQKTIAASVVNIREKPSRQAAILFKARRGERVTISREQNGWQYVEFDDGRTGWVAGYLLQP